MKFTLPVCLFATALATNAAAQAAPQEPQRPSDEFLAALERAWERTSIHADFRLRGEANFNLDDKDGRERARIRARLGVNHDLTDELVLGARIVTGDRDDPNSSHITIGDGFDGLEFTLDRAFLKYSPDWAEGTWVTGGKFSHGFQSTPIYGELVWDGDVQPEGVAIGHGFGEVGPIDALDCRAGFYTTLENGGGSDGYLAVAEVRAKGKVGDELGSTIATAYYNYNDPTPGSSSSLVGDNAGNAVIDLDGDTIPDRFVSDFGIWHSLVSVEVGGLDTPVKVSGEYVKNTRAEIDGDQGWAFGAGAGSKKEAGDWWVYYQWQVIEQDAVFSPFAQDDFLFQTNHRSHVAGVNYQFTSKVGVHLWALVSARDDTTPGVATADSEKNQWRVRLDLNAKL